MKLKEQSSMEQSLYKALKPLYKELLEQLSKEDKETTSPFCVKWQGCYIELQLFDL